MDVRTIDGCLDGRRQDLDIREYTPIIGLPRGEYWVYGLYPSTLSPTVLVTMYSSSFILKTSISSTLR